MMLLRMVEILFGLFVWNSNGELRKTTTISSPPWNSRITNILTISEQQIYIWMHNYYFYSENVAILLFLTHPNISFMDIACGFNFHTSLDLTTYILCTIFSNPNILTLNFVSIFFFTKLEHFKCPQHTK
jgi:hypothetical protein